MSGPLGGIKVLDMNPVLAGMYATTAILAALKERDQTGKGQTIDVPLYDSQVAWLANQAMNFLIGGVTPERRGTAHPNLVPYQTFASRDGYITLAVGNDSQFAACATCIGKPELAEDVLTDAYAAERGLVRTLEHALDPELPTVSNPVGFSRTPVCYGLAPPTLGQHTDEVLGDWLGYSGEKIEALRAAGAV